MKKPTVAPPALVVPPSVRPYWRWLAAGSLVMNLVLAVWLWQARESRSAASSLPSPTAATAATATRPRELQAYAALGSFMADNNRIASLGWSESQFGAFLDGFRASYAGRGVPLDDEARALQSAISERVQAALAAEQPDPVEEYFQALRDKEGVTKTPSGLHYRITEPGFGPTPGGAEAVVISFTARMPDGHSLPELSRTRMRSAVADLLPGLAEGVQLLRVGGKGLLYLPPALGFSEGNWPPQVPKGAPLVFFVELHEIETATK